MQTLPANKQAEIRKEVEKQFKDMPYPWNPGWQGGSLGKAVDRQTAKNINEKKDETKTLGNQLSAEYESMSLQGKIDEINRKIDVLNDVNYYETYLSSLNEQSKALQDEIKQIEDEIGITTLQIQGKEKQIEILDQFRSSYDWTTNPDDEETRLQVEQADRDISILKEDIRENLLPKLTEQGKRLVCSSNKLKPSNRKNIG